MFKRIKNLLDISRYTVEELKRPRNNRTSSAFLNGIIDQEELLSSTPDSAYKMATIINMQAEDPFKNFDNETPEQSSNDSTARN